MQGMEYEGGNLMQLNGYSHRKREEEGLGEIVIDR